MQLNVVKNAKKNTVVGLANKLIVVVCPFITRTAIQYILNEQYLGLTSLFNSVLAVLSLAEMGFSSAVVYNMYKPAAEGDVKTINALINFFKKAYRIVGIVILIVGLAIIPLLPHFISGTYPTDISINTIYCIFLSNTVISYFMYAYLSSIIVVHQRDDINSTCNAITKICLTILQVVLLSITHNFFCFVSLIPIFTVINNLWIAWRVRKQFPQYKCEGKLDQHTLHQIKKLVVGTFIQRVCATTRNAIDSICISTFLGLSLTAIYSNYYYIMDAVTQMMAVISVAFMGGIGNHVAIKSKPENFKELRNLDFAYLWISGWCMTCLLCLYQPFMSLWMGQKMLLPFQSVVLLCLYFYMLKIGDMRFMYTSANGLWWETKWCYLCETICNVLLNIILGKLFGINGIIIATMISYIIFNYIISCRIVFKHYFGMKYLGIYFKYQISQTIIMFLFAVITLKSCSLFNIDNLWITIIVRLLICLVIPNGLMLLVYRKSNVFKYVINRVFNRTRKLKIDSEMEKR